MPGHEDLTAEEARRESERLRRMRRGPEVAREMPTEVNVIDHQRVEDTPLDEP